VKAVLPRVIYGNLGDLASRWGVLRALHRLGVTEVTVFRNLAGDTPPLPFHSLPYRPLHNLWLDRPAWQALRRSDTVLWAVGLDMQDDSSLARLIYLWTAFRLYRALGLRIICLFQGAGPITTRAGRWLARAVLDQVDVFVARDPGTSALIEKLNPRPRRIVANDAIFLPGLEDDRRPHEALAPLLAGGRPVIGVNVRQWFHFASSLVPYQFSRRAYQHRSEARMPALLNVMAEVVGRLRTRLAARVLLISAYQPGIRPWEDDLPWLARIKARFAEDDEVQLVHWPLEMPPYYDLMARLDAMIGMRLHSSLVALRFGVPSVNISYTLKGGDILRHMGLPESVFSLEAFLHSPEAMWTRLEAILAQHEVEHRRVQEAVNRAIAHNLAVLQELLHE